METNAKIVHLITPAQQGTGEALRVIYRAKPDEDARAFDDMLVKLDLIVQPVR